MKILLSTQHRLGSGKKEHWGGSGYRVVFGRLEHDTFRPSFNGTKGLRP